jgi:hypothetical protein
VALDQQIAERRAFAAFDLALQDWEIAYIHRPLEIVERIDGEPVVVETRPHIDLLFDRVTGYRVLRNESDPEAFDAAAAKARCFDIPCRVHRGQLEFVLDRSHKAVGFFGGERAGKTQAVAERAVDSWCLLGGIDFDPEGKQVNPHRFGWIAPSLDHTRIGVDKLRAILPAELIVSYPPRKTTTDQTIYMADGSQIKLIYASKIDAANLKGWDPWELWFDELCSVKHAENWSVALGRLTDHDGQLCFSSTPTQGSFAEEKVFRLGMHRDEIADQTPDIVFQTITCFDNPWQSPEAIERRIRTSGGRDNPAVRREVFGEWVGDGELLWREYAPSRHLIEGDGRDCESWGYTNINRTAFARIFRDTSADLRYVGFVDFNVWPMTLLVCQVGVKDRADQNDRSNWTLFVIDEIQKKAKSEYDFARFVAGAGGGCAADFRKIPRTTFAAMALVCDGTSAYPAPHMTTVGQSAVSTARWHAFEQCGFDCKPPCYTATGKPANPTRKDRISLTHKLFIEDRIKIHGERCRHGPYSLIQALETQKRAEDGTAEKKAGNASDRWTSSTDALGYGIWAAFSEEIAPPPARYISR